MPEDHEQCGDAWRLPPGAVAVRLTINAPPAGGGIRIENGTVALLERAGAVVAILPSGFAPAEDLRDWSSGSDASAHAAVLINARLLDLRFRLQVPTSSAGLRGMISVGMSVFLADPLRLAQRLLQGKERLDVVELALALEPDFRDSATAWLTALLASGRGWLAEAEQGFTAHMDDVLALSGLVLKSVRSFELDAATLATIEQSRRKAEQSAARADLEHRIAQDDLIFEQEARRKAQKSSRRLATLEALDELNSRKLRALMGLAGLPTDDLPAAHPAAPNPPPSMEQIAAPLRVGVGLVMIVNPGQPEEVAGTAWAWQAPFMATNAHVIDHASGRLAAEGWIEVRLSGTRAPGLRIAAWQRHPRYGETQIAGAGTGETLAAYDVGLLRVPGLDPRLKLPCAPVDKLAKLLEGQTVAYWGFPLENIISFKPGNPGALFRSGTLAHVTGWSLERESSAHRWFLQHTAPVAGGASGSPLFDEGGEVIGIVCGGNLATIEASCGQRIRVAIAGGASFAMRVDLLDEVHHP